MPVGKPALRHVDQAAEAGFGGPKDSGDDEGHFGHANVSWSVDGLGLLVVDRQLLVIG
jgi:hypothetical protein